MTNERMKNGNIRYTNHRLIPLENDLINLFILNGGPFAFVFMHLIQVHTNRHFNALYSDLIARALNSTTYLYHIYTHRSASYRNWRISQSGIIYKSVIPRTSKNPWNCFFNDKNDFVRCMWSKHCLKWTIFLPRTKFRFILGVHKQHPLKWYRMIIVRDEEKNYYEIWFILCMMKPILLPWKYTKSKKQSNKKNTTTTSAKWFFAVKFPEFNQISTFFTSQFWFEFVVVVFFCFFRFFFWINAPKRVNIHQRSLDPNCHICQYQGEHYRDQR